MYDVSSRRWITHQGLEDEKLELRRLRKLSRAYQMVTGLSLEITPEQKVVATMENDSRAGRLIQFEVRYGRVSTRMHSALEWLLRLCAPRSWTWTRTPRRWSTNPVSQNGYLLSRRVRSLPANASGFDTHRDSISSRFDCSPDHWAATGAAARPFPRNDHVRGNLAASMQAYRLC
jgi:hypothetical protein